MNVLDVDKSETFVTPLGDDITRTGTMQDGSCFFHSVLRACNPRYVFKSKRERQDYVKNIRKGIAMKMGKDRWHSLSKGTIALTSVQETLRASIKQLYIIATEGKPTNKMGKKILKKSLKDPKKTAVYNIILSSILDQNELLTGVIERANDLSSTVHEFRKNLVRKCDSVLTTLLTKKVPGLDSSRRSKFVNAFCELMEKLVDICETTSYRKYINSITDTKESIDTTTINILSDEFDRDIYFIDAKTRLPYQDMNSHNIKNRRSIVILWVGDCHYEIVGRLEAENKNRIQRDFDNDDPFIQKIYTFLNEPSVAVSRYPSLAPYINEKIRRKVFEASDYENSDSERYSPSCNCDMNNESDSDYDT